MFLLRLPLFLCTGLLRMMPGAPGDREAGERERPRWRRMIVGISLDGLGAIAEEEEEEEEGARALRGAQKWSSWSS